MKNRFACLFGAIVVTGSSWAQVTNHEIRGNRLLEKQNRNVNSFSKLHVSMGIQTQITDQQPGTVQIEAESSIMPYITTQLKGDTLVITTLKGQPLTDILPIKVTLGVGQLDAIKVDIGASLTSQKDLATPSLTCELRSGGQLTSMIDVSSLDLDIQGGSKANLMGQVRAANLALSGGSKLTGEELKTARCKVTLRGGCQALLSVDEALTASVKGSSKLQYFGNPILSSQTSDVSVIEGIKRK